MKNLAIRTPARTGLRAFECDSFLAQPRSKLVQIVAMRGPADEPRLFEFRNYGVLFNVGLLWIGGDDLQVASSTEREKCVLRAAPGMNTAKSAANGGALLDEGDTAFEIIAAQKNVIEQKRNLFCRPR